jgi:chemotaxis signal transduction protein
MKIAPSERRASRRASRSEPVIAFSISGHKFAISANAVQEIRTTDSVAAGAVEISVTGKPKVRHCLPGARGATYIVSGWLHFGLSTSRPAQVILLRDSRVGVLVDSIDGMETMKILMSLPAGFCGPERSWYRGVTVFGENVVPVVSPLGFLSSQEIAELDADSASVSDSRPLVSGAAEDSMEKAK